MDRGSAANRGRLADARHELLVKVAVGGTSTVFVGRERGKSELVAIKRMHPYLASDESARTQMLREASIAGRARHDHLVHIRGVEQSGEELLLVMDYVEGGSLAELLAAGPVPLGAGLRLVLDAASGLSALHEVTDPETRRRLGFVHRDISPQNILVGIDGRARLGDFGLVKRTDVSTTHTTVVRGKVAYMAPEQIEGQRARQAADIYAMGVVLWEVVSGERLFRGVNDADTMRRVLVGAVPALADRGHPAAFDGVVRRCVARDPKARFAGVEEMVAAIEHAAGDVGLASRDEIAALVDEVLGETLRQRRQTVEASANAETTATGDVDIDAILASGRASVALSHVPTAPLPDAGPERFVESDTLPMTGAPPVAIEEEETVAVEPEATPASAPASEAPAASHAPSAPRSSASTRTILVAVVAALAGASVSWLVARAPGDADDVAAGAVTSAPTQATASPDSARPDTSTAGTTTPSAAPEVDVAPDVEPTPEIASTAAVEPPPAATPRPVPRPKPPKKTGEPSKRSGGDDVLVPDNPYR